MPPCHLFHRETFVILQHKGVHQRVAHPQRAGDARLFARHRAHHAGFFGQVTVFVGLAGGGILVVDDLRQLLVRSVQLQRAQRGVHRRQRLLVEGLAGVGDDRVEGRIHLAHLVLMVHADVTAGERAVAEELRGGHRALQAVGVDVHAAGGRATLLRQQAGLLQPGVEVVPHIHFQHPALGGQLAARRFPGRPGLRRRLRQHAAVVGQRRAQVMAAHDQHLFQLITAGFRQRVPGE